MLGKASCSTHVRVPRSQPPTSSRVLALPHACTQIRLGTGRVPGVGGPWQALCSCSLPFTWTEPFKNGSYISEFLLRD